MGFRIKNFTMQKFNNDVNNSGDLDMKYSAWSTYRGAVTGFLNRAVLQTSSAKSIIVFGAGECNDIDIKFLCNTFARVVLTDVDEQSIYDGLSRQGIKDLSKLQVCKVEYTGLEDAGFFDTLAALCSENSPIAQISEFVQNALSNVRAPGLSALAKDGFDVVLSCPVYTQIVFSQAEVLTEILAHYSTYTHSDMHELLESFSGAMPALIQKYNDLLLSCAKPGGALVVLADCVEAHPSDPLLQTIDGILTSLPLNTHALSHLICDHGLKFGVLGKDDLLAKAKQQDIFFARWPFDEHRHYLVCGIFARKK
jgi:hypothetical protein